MSRRSPVLLLVFAAFVHVPMLAERTPLKPGFNIFWIAQDAELGLRISKLMEAEIEVLRDPRADDYLVKLGRRLAAKARGAGRYRFQFKIVNDGSINATGLPGGIVYIQRGTVEAAANEAELAGVIAHEIGHIVLRHGSHRISSAYVLQQPLSALGRIGSKTVAEVLAAIDGGFTASSIVLRNSLEAEREADLMATQIVYDAGYDPKAAAGFFAKLDVESRGSEARFGDQHPTPANRMASVTMEIERLSSSPINGLVDSLEFRSVRSLISSFPAPQNATVPTRF